MSLNFQDQLQTIHSKENKKTINQLNKFPKYLHENTTENLHQQQQFGYLKHFPIFI